MKTQQRWAEIEAEADALIAKIEAYKQRQKPSAPRFQDGDIAFKLYSCGEIQRLIYHEVERDSPTELQGNLFLTLELAEQERDRRAATYRVEQRLAELEVEHGVEVVDWGNDDQIQHTVYYGHRDKRFYKTEWNTDNHLGFTSTSGTVIVKLIQDCEADLKIIWGVE